MNSIENTVMINGVLTDHINISDRSIHYGDGLFETVLCNNNKLYYWQQHYQRLLRSANSLDIKCPAEQSLLDDIGTLLAEHSTEEPWAIKIILSRGIGERGYHYSKKISSNRFVMISKVTSDYSSLLCGKLLSGALFLCKTQVSINESLAGIKHLNRLENVLASNELNDTSNKQYIDGVMLNAEHHVIECIKSNIFAIKDGQLFTPELKRSGVRGIMRDEVIRIAADNNIHVTKCNISIDELLAMDELFITNSLIGLKSINNLVDTGYKETRVTQLIYSALLNTKENYVQII